MKNTEEETNTEPPSPYQANWVQLDEGSDAVTKEEAGMDNTQKDMHKAEDDEDEVEMKGEKERAVMKGEAKAEDLKKVIPNLGWTLT